MDIDVIGMIEQMAEHGHAPTDGCALFGVGYDDAFDRLKRKYLEARFGRGGSAEKFVIGPFGSGKTHFLRQLMELAREMGCVTAEVALNKDLDFTKSLIVYREVTREIRAPEREDRGIQALFLAGLDRVRQQARGNTVLADQLAGRWVAGLDNADFELEAFGRLARQGIEAHLRGDEATFLAACRWLEGEVTDRVLARELSLAPIAKAAENLHGRRALLSLFQFVRRAGFRGTVVTFDEAEQGLGVDQRRMDRILSMLQSHINALADLKQGSALVVYAFTPDLVEQIERFAALQQRVEDPGHGQGFFDGNTLAPRIDLTRRGDSTKELQTIGHRLVDLLFDHANLDGMVEREHVYATVDELATEIALEDVSSSSRRMMVKRTCAILMRVHDEGIIEPVTMPDRMDEDEV